MLSTVNAQSRRPCAGRDQNESTNQHVIADLDGGLVGKARASVKNGNACLRELLFPVCGNRLSEGPLKLDQAGPVYLHVVATNSLARHLPRALDHLCRADQHFFRIATA